MMIRRAEEKDMAGINRLLCQVLAVHHNGRPDLFQPDAKKYTDSQLKQILSDGGVRAVAAEHFGHCRRPH